MNNRMQFLEIVGGCVDEYEVLWFCPFKFNSLFSYNLKNEELIWRGVIPEEKKWQQALYRNCVKYNEEIYMIPYNAKDIAVFNTVNGTFTKIIVDDFGYKTERYFCAAVYGRKLYIFGDRVPCILILDCDTKKIVCYDELHQRIDRIKQRDDNFNFAHSMVVEDNLCYMIAFKINALVVFDMRRCEYNIIELGDARGVYANLLKKGNYIYLIPGIHRKTAIWDLEKNSLKELGEEIKKSFQYNVAFLYDETLYELPLRGDNIMSVSMKNGEIVFDEKGLEEYYDKRFCGDSVNSFYGNKFTYTYEDENRIIFFCRMNREIYTINKTTGELCHNSLVMDIDTQMKLAKYFCEPLLEGRRVDYIKENIMFDVGAFAYYLKEGALF